MLNSLSHELRTPIATIIGAVDTLRDNKEKLSPQQQNELFIQLDHASVRLNRQVENLLNISRLESGMLKLKTDWCDLNELIHKVIGSIDHSAESHKIIFRINESLPLFKLDEGLIEQVIRNIIHNALLYTPNQSEVHIDAFYYDVGCKIIISDNGSGFPVHEIEKVFDKFYRLPNTGSGGSGLGLSIVKGFVEAHNGNIRLRNNELGGAEFTITIPCETSFITNLKNE